MVNLTCKSKSIEKLEEIIHFVMWSFGFLMAQKLDSTLY